LAEPNLLRFELEMSRYLPPAPQGGLFPHEAQLGFLLPADYRAFLLRIGNGPMGPYYGLTGFDLSRDPNSLRRCFPFSRVQADQAEFARRNGTDADPLYFEDGQEDYGSLHLGEMGCGGYCLLAVNGDAFGYVWSSWDTGVSLLTRDGGTPHSFLTWYEHWLDVSLKPETLERWRSYAPRQ
jgi:hypothetical protein